MSDTITKIRPGVLVSLKTSVRGGVSYDRVELDNRPEGAAGSLVKVETTRIVEDCEENQRAHQARRLAAHAIRRVCIKTKFGLLCPHDKREELNGAIMSARASVDAFNRDARITRVQVYILQGEIAETDDEATRAIGSEIRQLMEDMQNGVNRVDAAAIREAANRARQLGAMLSEEQSERVSAAVKAARTAARQIVKRIEKGGEEAEVVAAELKRDLGPVETARFAFLDASEAPAAETGNDGEPDMPSVEINRFGGLFDGIDHESHEQHEPSETYNTHEPIGAGA